MEESTVEEQSELVSRILLYYFIGFIIDVNR